MKEIKITGCGSKEALEQIDTIEELGIKERGCLRLLTEEMFSMCRELLDVYSLDFEIKQDSKLYTLTGITEMRVNDTVREQLLSASSSGKNAANKGVKGILGAVFELFSMERDGEFYRSVSIYGMHNLGGAYGHAWTLSRYITEIAANQGKNEWDGLEKSIIANFADDISIGVRSHRLKMTVTKTF